MLEHNCEQLHEHHNAHWREHGAVLSTPRTVCRCTCVHTSHLWLKSRPVCHSMSSMHAHLCLVVWVFSLHPSLYFFLQFLFQLFLMPNLVPDEISMEDPLCDSSFGSMVTLDYVNPLTKTIHGRKVESPESTRQRVESSLLTKHNDRIAGKGITSMTHYKWFTWKFLCHKRWRFRMQKQQWTRNGRSSNQTQHGSWRKSRARRRLFSKHKETNKKKVHFAALMDICHLKNAELEPNLQKYKRHSRAPWWHWKRQLWCLCSFSWTGLVCVPNDCRKSNGCYCKITRLWRTSSRRSIRVHSGKTGARSQVAQNSKVRVPRRMDTSRYTWMLKKAGKEQAMAPMWKKLMKKSWCWRANFISWSRILGMQSTWMETECNHWKIYEDVWITYFCWSNWKVYQGGRNLTQKQSRGPTTWKDMLENALREKASWLTKKEQFFTVSSPCLGDHQFNQEELESVGELSQVCSQMVSKRL